MADKAQTLNSIIRYFEYNKYKNYNLKFVKGIDPEKFYYIYGIYSDAKILKTQLNIEKFMDALAFEQEREVILAFMKELNEELGYVEEVQEPTTNGPVNENKVDVLDHGFVRLIDSMGNDLSIVRAARVSYDAAWRVGEDDEGDKKLLRYLWKNKHSTPFESVTFTFEVKAPIFVFRQWHRHRTFSYNELSARYKQLPKEFYVPASNIIGIQSTNNKQGRNLDVVEEMSLIQQRDNEIKEYVNACNVQYALYEKLLASNWPRELARAVLPVSMYSHMFCTVNLLNLFKFLTLRCDAHAQHEIRVYANAMLELITPIVPVAVQAWKDFK